MRKRREISADLQKIRNHKLNTCIFGCGMVGTGIGYDILKSLEIDVSYYCDNNSELWGTEIKDGIKCISPSDLYQMEDIPCFIFIGHIYQEEVIRQLKKHMKGILITHFELVSLDVIVNGFLDECRVRALCMKECDRFVWTLANLKIEKIRNINRKKCAVYTCITGGYDDVTEPRSYSEEYDYYLISDKKPENPSVYQWIDIECIMPDIVKDNPRKNRFCKILGPFIFSEYKHSVYIDGNVRITDSLEGSIGKIGSSGIAVHLLPFQNCIYEHALLASTSKEYNQDSILQQINEYHEAGMPRDYGMFECTVMVRDNNNLVCRQVMLDWWNEVFNRSYRDQLSFTYCLWKNDVKFEDVGVLGKNHRESSVFKMLTEHHTKIVNGKYKYIQ